MTPTAFPDVPRLDVQLISRYPPKRETFLQVVPDIVRSRKIRISRKQCGNRCQLLRAWLALMAQHSIDLVTIDGVERVGLLSVVGHAQIMPERSDRSRHSEQREDDQAAQHEDSQHHQQQNRRWARIH